MNSSVIPPTSRPDDIVFVSRNITESSFSSANWCRSFLLCRFQWLEHHMLASKDQRAEKIRLALKIKKWVYFLKALVWHSFARIGMDVSFERQSVTYSSQTPMKSNGSHRWQCRRGSFLFIDAGGVRLGHDLLTGTVTNGLDIHQICRIIIPWLKWAKTKLAGLRI